MTDAATEHTIWERGMMALSPSQREAIRALREAVRVRSIEAPVLSSLEAEVSAMEAALP